MSTVQLRHTLSQKNRALREQNERLKLKKHDMTQHLSTILRRSKQMEKLKSALRDQLQHSIQASKAQNNKKKTYIDHLFTSIHQLNSELTLQLTHLKKLQGQYEICLQDYDKVLHLITKQIEQCKLIQADISLEQQNNENIKSMIFDYQRLKRVLEQQKDYFKQLSISQQKDHQQRIKQLELMLQKIIKQQQQQKAVQKLNKYHIAFNHLHLFFNIKLRQYSQHFIRSQIYLHHKIKIYVKTLNNCFSLASLKHQLTLKHIFYRWHHQVYPKQTLRNLVEATTINNLQSLRKLVTINQMTEQLNSKNMNIFHLYEKGKYLNIITNKIGRKDMHYGFNRWRKNYQIRTEKLNFLHKITHFTIPNRQKRIAFKTWKTNATLSSRYLLANHLLNQYISTRQLCRTFRKWRFIVSEQDLQDVNQFIYNVKQKNKINRKINYEKRKTKALTSLYLNLTKIKLRNYFYRYLTNIKYLIINNQKNTIKNEKQQYLTLKTQNKSISSSIQLKNQKIPLKIFQTFSYHNKLNPIFKKWYNTTLFLKKQSTTIYHLAIKKQIQYKTQAFNKFLIFTEFQRHQQMKSILQNLNNNLSIAYQQSNQLKQQISSFQGDLKTNAIAKIFHTINRNLLSKKELYYHIDSLKNVRKLYKSYIIRRFTIILQHYFLKQSFTNFKIYQKNKKKDEKLQKLFKQHQKDKLKKDQSRIFYALKGILQSYKTCFNKIYQTLNIYPLYRMAVGFTAIERKSTSQNIKIMNKKITNNDNILKIKDTNRLNLQKKKQQIKQKQILIFIKLINFKNRNIQIKYNKQIKQIIHKYFNIYRSNVQQKKYFQEVLKHLSDFITHKNKTIFWRGFNILQYENSIETVRQELATLKKKKKICQEKHENVTIDIKKRVSQASAIHSQKLQHYQSYLTKSNNILNSYQQKQLHKHNQRLLKITFHLWKTQYKALTKFLKTTNKIFQKYLVKEALIAIIKIITNKNSKHKSQYLCANLLYKKAKYYLKDCLILWRVNIRKKKIKELQEKTKSIAQEREEVADQCKIKGKLIGQERLRLRRRNIFKSCFMALKAEYRDRVYNKRFKLTPFTQKWNEQLLKKCINGLKWIMFYKKTKRAYLSYKKQKNEYQLKNIIFFTLKTNRQNYYLFINKINKIFNHNLIYHIKKSFNSIINLGNKRKSIFHYHRKRILRHLILNKVTQIRVIKIRVMAKWYSWLIPYKHYLCNILKYLQISQLRKTFARIRQYSCWHHIYIKKLTERVTTQGYTSITNITNNLIKQGYDPEQIKQYLSKHNQKDYNQIRNTIMKMKTWGMKQPLVRGWNSWKQYIILRRRIKKSLGKVLQIAQGLGKCWNRWRSKDIQFNAILQKQSRGNMMARFKDLEKLMKDYKRDIKDSKQHCQQLKLINDEYSQKSTFATQIALSALSNSVKKGLKQALYIWKIRLHEYKRQQLDTQYDKLTQGISIVLDQKNKLKYKIILMKQQGNQLKLKCNLGKQCGQILQQLMKQRDNLSINLADKQHNLKLLLEDNLKLKLKIKSAKINAQKLINKVQNIQNYDY